jgi:hypothetical protein
VRLRYSGKCFPNKSYVEAHKKLHFKHSNGYFECDCRLCVKRGRTWVNLADLQKHHKLLESVQRGQCFVSQRITVATIDSSVTLQSGPSIGIRETVSSGKVGKYRRLDQHSAKIECRRPGFHNGLTRSKPLTVPLSVSVLCLSLVTC